MPLKSGKSEKTIGENIAQLEREDYPPKQAEAIAFSNARKTAKDSESKREYDLNGWAEIRDNPLSKIGVFDYLGSQISPDLDPNTIYKVYRPEEELSNPETIKSFQLLPWTDEHAMLGSESDGLTPAEKKGIHGVIGSDVYYADGYLKGNLKIFSNKLAELIESGKKELSIGYRCLYDIVTGVYDGIKYDAIQRNIRGNHVALVEQGRAGSDVAVLDHLKITFDTKELRMPDLKKPDSAKDEELTLESLAQKLNDLCEAMKLLQPQAKVEDGEPDDMVKKADVTDEDEKKEDKEEEKKDEKKEDKKEGMDSALITLTEEIKQLKANGTKALLLEVSRRDVLASKLSQHIGTFDSASKTLDEVAAYGVKKLGLTCAAGHEESTLNGYLAGRRINSVVVAEDEKVVSSSLDAYLKGDK